MAQQIGNLTTSGDAVPSTMSISIKALLFTAHRHAAEREMRLLVAFLSLLPQLLHSLQPETIPRPSVPGFSTITGTCDPAVGVISGGRYRDGEGTLKACSQLCAQSDECKGFNFVTDQNVCQLFREECSSTRAASRAEPARNFYLKGEIACSLSTVGKEFFAVFMANRVAQPQNKSLELWFTQDRMPGGTKVLLETDPSQGETKKITVPYKQAVYALMPFTWKVTDIEAGVSMEKKAMRLTSDVDFVFYGVNKEYFTSDAFLGIPARALGTHYIANCHWPTYYNCEFAFTPAMNETTIRVTLPRNSTRNAGNWTMPPPTEESRCNVPFEGGTYSNGDTLVIQLSVFEVAQVQDPCDLTGTVVVADKPVAFWSGNSRVNVGDGPSRDHQVENLFSIDTWGFDCAAWPTPNRNPGLVDYWTINAAEDNTVITVDSNEIGQRTYTLNAAESVRFPSNSVTEWQRFSSNKRFQAVQYAHSAVEDRVPGDPSMTTCIPSDQFGFGYTFVTTTGVATSYTNYLTLITKQGGEDGFLLDDQALTDVRWHQVPGSDLVGGSYQLDPAKLQFRIEHRVRETTFEAYIYGSGDRESVAYPTGACIKALGECVESTMFIADGKDNDCDRVIDEELCDGVDNDLDGLADEDCYDEQEVSQEDRCPVVKTVRACRHEQLKLNCEFNSIKIISANYGNLGRAKEDSCKTVDCGWLDFSKPARLQCDGEESCSLPGAHLPLNSECFSHAQVQYVCLTGKETSHGHLTGYNYKASSHLGAVITSRKCDDDPWAPKHASHDGTNAVKAWRPAGCDRNSSWLQTDLGFQYKVGWYVISGCRRNDFWVTKFGISYSLDGDNWTVVEDDGGGMKVFDGNVDPVTAKVCTLFKYDIIARYVRIHPLEYNGYPCAHIDFGHHRDFKRCPLLQVANSWLSDGVMAGSGYGETVNVECNDGWATRDGRIKYNVKCGEDGQWAAFRV